MTDFRHLIAVQPTEAPHYVFVQFPRCARCETLVRSMTRHPDRGPVMRFSVYCHGETETLEIHVNDLGSGGRLAAGVAFNETNTQISDCRRPAT